MASQPGYKRLILRVTTPADFVIDILFGQSHTTGTASDLLSKDTWICRIFDEVGPIACHRD